MSSPHHSTPYHPRNSPDGSWHGGILLFRTQRVAFLLLATALASVVLFSGQHPGEKHPQACQTSDLQTTCMPDLRSDSPPVTVTVTRTAPPTTKTVIVEPPVQPVVFALVMFSESSAKEGAVLLKSAIMYTSRPLQFHIVCDEAARTYLDSRFRLLIHPLHSISVRFYQLSFQSMLDRISREGGINTDHSAGIPGLMKLFLHEILPDDVEMAIYVDTDAFLLTDPALLWEEFSQWDSGVSISMPSHPDQDAPEWHHASRICSCIMLLHLGRLRAARLMDSSIYRADSSGLFPPALSPPTFEALFGPPGPDGQYMHVALGDQGYWWAIVSNRKDLFRPLVYDWEVTSCLLDMYMTGLGHDDTPEDEESRAMIHLRGTPYEGQVVIPKLVHFNCLHDIYYNWAGWSNPENSLTKRWKPAVDYHVGFKWLWLNRGSASSVDIQVLIDPLFADQRFDADLVAEHLHARD
ncbi:hypothetical protein EDB84DRAFT_477760 [Lactarius hengduanensis]|nr:hypothetical protein EDB84DRAFT_477760 [Lactarius hengduanensis]